MTRLPALRAAMPSAAACPCACRTPSRGESEEAEEAVLERRREKETFRAAMVRAMTAGWAGIEVSFSSGLLGPTHARAGGDARRRGQIFLLS